MPVKRCDVCKKSFHDYNAPRLLLKINQHKKDTHGQPTI